MRVGTSYTPLAFIMLQRVLGEEAAVLDGVDAGGDRQARRGVAVAVGRDLAVPGMRLGDDGRSVSAGGELRHVHRVGLGEHAAAERQILITSAPHFIW